MRLNTALLATAKLIGGTRAVRLHLLALTVLGTLALFAAAARLLGSATWGGIATLIFLTVPAAAWVGRLPLSEGPSILLTCSAVLAATLAVQDEDPNLEHVAAFLLGMIAWTRGNGLLVAPMLLVALAWSARHLHAKASIFTYALTVGSGLVVHAWDAWPYVHDELRRLGVAAQRPQEVAAPYLATLVVLAVIGATRAWDRRGIPTLADRTSSIATPSRLLHVSAITAAGVLTVSAVAWPLVHDQGPPFARLPLLARVVSPVVLVASVFALLDVVRRERWVRDVGPTRRVTLDEAPWLLAFLVSMLVSALIYVVPAIPTNQLPYYGRYFVPEILPALALAAAHAFRTISLLTASWLHRNGARQRRTAGAIAFALVASTLAYPAGPMFLSRDFRTGDQIALRAAADELAHSLPRDAIVLVPSGLDLSRHAFNQIGGVLDFASGATVLEIPRRSGVDDVLHELDAAYAQHAEYGPPQVALLVPPAWLPPDRALHDAPDAGAWPIEAPLGWSSERIIRVEALVERVAPSRNFDWPGIARSRVAFALVVLRRLDGGAAEDPALRATRRILVDVDGTRLSDDFAPVTSAVVAMPSSRSEEAPALSIVAGSWQRWDTPPTHAVVTMNVETSVEQEVELRVLGDVVARSRLPASPRTAWSSPPLPLELALERWRDPAVRDPSNWRVETRAVTTNTAGPAPVSRIVWWREATLPRP